MNDRVIQGCKEKKKQTKEETAAVHFVITGMKTFTKTSCFNKFP